MTRPLSHARRLRKPASTALALVFALALLPPPPRAAAQDEGAPQQIPVIAPGSAYRLTTLLSDVPGLAPVLDPLLVNPWGLSLTSTSPFWVANNGTSTTQLIQGDVGGAPVVLNPARPTVTIPGGLPTGTVANTVATEFVLPGPCASAPCGANFLFASITGNIIGWDPNAPAAGSNTAVIAASHPGHVFTGLAIANNGVGNFLYAADFANNHIDVFNSSFALQPQASFPFADPTIPNTPGNTYHPHNVQAITVGSSTSLYVTYAKVGAGGLPEDGVGNGFVRRFNTNGVRDLTFGINNGALNAPWGVTLAPASFGIFGGALLVGNFGEGNPSIHAYNPTTGAFLGTVQDESGNGIVIDELWDLKFGNGGAGGDPDSLYFAAGIGEEEHGLFGRLDPTTASATSLVQFSTDDYVIGEGSGHIDITVTRSGDVSGAASVNYNTFDQSQAGHANQKSDYEIALGSLSFAPGETSKTFRLLIVDDRFDETDEVIEVMLSNPSGAGVGMGSPNTAEVTVLDNDTGAPTSNPIDESPFFVRQHYLDFLNREPDAGGFAFWQNQIEQCGADAQCREAKRNNVSAAFFLSIEFQETGFLAYLAHEAAFGERPLYGEFMRDVQALQRGFVFGQPGAAAQLEANKRAYFDEFVTRPEFVARYGALSNRDYVSQLLANNTLSPTVGNLHVTRLTGAQEVPPNGSPAAATFFMKRSPSGGTSTFTASLFNLTNLTSAQTGAHIHGPALPGATAPVLVPLPLGEFNDFQFTLTPEQMNILVNNQLYVNVHTTNFPGGEIRGQLQQPLFRIDVLENGLNSGALSRAQVLRIISEFEELKQAEFNAAFVTMQYFGYLRRDPDTAGFNFWLNKLNSFGGDFIAAEMVKAFITSAEYRQRFGPS